MTGETRFPRGRIAIVGAGLVGGGRAIAFARAGHEVAMFNAASGAASRHKRDMGAQA